MSGPIQEEILRVLTTYLSPIVAKSILSVSVSRARVDPERPRPGDHLKLASELKKGVQAFTDDAEQQRECVARLSELLAERAPKKPACVHPVSIEVREEADIVTARSRGTELCLQLGFPKVVQVKVATAISELARNIVQYAGEGEITISSMENGIEVVARDQGPGIEHLDTVLSGEYSSKTGMGMGLAGTKKLVDEFDIETQCGLGTKITIRKFL